jgi:Flp pilus assembly protein TadD
MIRLDLTNPHGLAPHVNIQTWQPRNLFPGEHKNAAHRQPSSLSATMRKAEMSNHLIDLERRASDFQKSGQIREAAELFSAIVKEQPDWEHGLGFYSLACCYEDLGQLELAEGCYNAALRFEPANPYFLGGLASFLYLHGEPEKAFNAYLTLLEVYKMERDEKGVEQATIALKALGKKMGLSEASVAERIDNTPL